VNTGRQLAGDPLDIGVVRRGKECLVAESYLAERGKDDDRVEALGEQHQTGVFVSNAGRAMITKRAKCQVIPRTAWSEMSAEWDRHFSIS
jgi:hypothetical protein